QSKGQRLLERALEMQRKALGENDPETLATMQGLGLCLLLQEKFELAKELLYQSWQGSERILGANDRETLQSMRFYGAFSILVGGDNEGLQLLNDVTVRKREARGEDDLGTAQVLGWALNQLNSRGKFADVEAISRLDLDLSERKFGEDHARTIT